MIKLIVPIEAGGVYDFAREIQKFVGLNAVQLVHLTKENAPNWQVEPEDSVILQFSGYGFEKRGIPLWLLHELEKRRKHFRTLGVFFHELYAFGPPWSSSFWLSPLQRHISRRLAEMSNFWMTNRQGSAQWLERVSGTKPHATLPVFSNVGELVAPRQIRSAKVIVFGSAGLRLATYNAAGNKLFAWAEQASLQIHDIGAPISDPQVNDSLRDRGVVLHGHLDEKEISSAMADAMFGLLAYPIDYVAKSGVFAAFCAHGMCPVLISEKYGQSDGLVANLHYLPNIPNSETFFNPLEIGQTAWAWYKTHDLRSHISILNKFIVGNATPE